MMDADHPKGWYYMGRDRSGTFCMRGPCTVRQLRQLFERGEISDETQVRSGPDTAWKPLGNLPLFAEISADEESGRKRPPLLRYGLVIALVAAVICFIIYERKRGPGYGASNPPQETLSKEAVITLTNDARVANHLSPLKQNELLDMIARSRAEDMFEKQYIAHVSPAGQGASDIAQKVGYRYKVIAENIGSGMFLTNRKVIDNWMQSPGHRNNILSTEVEDIGAAVVKGTMSGRETFIAVQIFGLSSPPVERQSCAAPSQELLARIEQKKAEVAGLNDRLAGLKIELEAERDSIEAERNLVRSEAQKNNLIQKINTYNEKSNWYNKMLEEVKTKSSVLQPMVDEYNRAVAEYKRCTASN